MLIMLNFAFPQTRFFCHWQRSLSSQLKPALFALVCYLIYLCLCLTLSAKKKTVQKNCFLFVLSIFCVNFLRPSDLKLAILCFVFAKLKMTVSAFPQTRFSCHWQCSFSSQLKPALFALGCYLIYLCFVPCSISQKENSSKELL